MEKLELEVSYRNGKIEDNIDVIKESIAETMKLYMDIKVTEDNIQKEKEELATLRKIKAAVETKRKNVKKEWNKPYEDFEARCKEITAIIDEPIELIDKQLAEFEVKRKEQKRKIIRQIFDENVGAAKDYLELAKIYNTKWENQTFTEKKILEEIKAAVDSTILAIDTIKRMNSEAVDEALLMYKSDLSLTNAISYINSYEVRKAEILKREKEKREREEKERLEKEKAEAECKEREAMRKRIEEEERLKADEQRRIDEAFEVADKEQQLPEDENESRPFNEVEEDIKPFTQEESQEEKKWHQLDVLVSASEYEKVVSYITELEIEVRY